jgi:predicted methyltransferase
MVHWSRPALVPVLILVMGALAACSGCGEVEDRPDLEALMGAARQQAIERGEVLGVHTWVTETTKALEPDPKVVYRTTAVQRDGGSDVLTEFDIEDKVVAHCLYREIIEQGVTSAWFLSGHHLQFGQRETPAGQLQFGRWFEHPALADAKVSDADKVDGRTAWVVDVPASVAPGAGSLEAVTDHVTAVEGLKRGPTYIFDLHDPLDTFTRLWVDRETGLLLRAEGRTDGPNGDEGSDTVISWTDFREVAPGVVLPHRQEFSVDGALFSTTRVTSVTPGAGTIATDVEAVHATYEVLAQTRNEQQYRELIARTDIKQAEPDPVRDEVFQPVELTRQLGISRGDVVADIGAGTGYFTTYLAEAAGPTGRVYATDINPAITDYLRRRMSGPEHNPHGNVECVVNDFDDLGLPEASVDLAFLAGVGLGRFGSSSDTNRAMIDSVFAAVKPGGRVVVIENRNQGSLVDAVSLGIALVDLDVEDPSWTPVGWPQRPAPLGHLGDIIVASFEAAGFQFSHSSDLIAGQAFLFLDKPS